MTHHELTPILQQLTEPLEAAIVTHPGFRAGGSHNALHHSCCGFATALLQEELVNSHGIETSRVVASKIDMIPRDPLFSRYLNHVVLYSADHDAIIDPSYSQFMKLFGINSLDAAKHPDLVGLYPTEKIAVIESGTHHEFADSFVSHCLGVRAAAASLVGKERTDNLSFFNGTPDDDVRKAIAAIWDIDLYEPFPLDDSDRQVSLHVTAREALIANKKTSSRGHSAG